MLYIAADHQGFDAKERIKAFFESMKFEYEDLGAHAYDKDDDYPDFAFKLGEAVVKGEHKGIILCGSGVGVCIAVNKVKGIRGAYAESLVHAVQSRQDDDANVLILDAMTFDPQVDFQIIETWLKTEFTRADRHIRRINKIIEYENK